MTNFEFVKTELKDSMLIVPFFSGDARGSFEKIFEKNIFNTAGINFNLSEAFMSISQKNVIRGMHFQYKNPQKKIVTVLKGECVDIIVDLREKSDTYLKYQTFILNDTNHNLLYVPHGFAHGFLSMTDDMHMLYLCDGAYYKEFDTGIMFDDKVLDIKWPIKDMNEAIHSERDMKLLSFEDFTKLDAFKDL